jgi:hypothetical protein
MEINRDNLLSLINTGVKREALSISGLERQAGVPRDTIRDFLRGKTQVLRADKLQKILRILEPQDTVVVSGIAGAGGEITASVSADKNAKDRVDCPPGFDPSDVVAVRVRGDAMLPVFHDGWVVYYSRRDDIRISPLSGGWQVPYNKADKARDPLAEFIGKPCVVGLAGGRRLLGTLKRSASGESYSLTHYNAADIRKIKPEWAAKIIFIKTE